MKHVFTLTSLVVVLTLNAVLAFGQTTQFTHHGNLGFAANGNGYDIQMTLFDTPTAGTGTAQTQPYEEGVGAGIGGCLARAVSEEGVPVAHPVCATRQTSSRLPTA